jgi:hypothetical protein
LELCELASKEQDPKKLIELFTQIETLLAAEDERVRPMPPLPKQSEPQNQTAMNLQQQQAEKAVLHYCNAAIQTQDRKTADPADWHLRAL